MSRRRLSFSAALAATCKTVTASAATLTVMLAEPPRTMDPADQNATATRSVLAPFYESLVAQDEHGNIQPALATAWSSSPDGRVWRFTLRTGVFFHDGSICDAPAAVASLNRLVAPDAALAGSGIFRKLISSVERDGNDIVITLHSPYADLLHLLSQTQAAIVSPVAATSTLARHADGTGPYRFGDWQDGERVRALRNDRYWGDKARLERIDWRWSPEPSVLNMALQTGDADVVMPLAPVFSHLYRDSDVAHVDRHPGGTQFWVALNNRLPPLDDARVRRALGLAIDRAALVAGLLHGNGTPACHPLTPETPGNLPCTPADGPDLQRAAALLRQAGHANGFPATVIVQEPEEPIAEALQAMWRPLGIKLAIRRQEAGVWMQSAFSGPAEKRKTGIGMIISSWSAPFVADLQLRPLYASANSAPGGANLGFYANHLVDAAMDQAAATLDPAERTAIYRTMQGQIAQDAPLLPLYMQDNLYGVRRNVHGVFSMPDGEIVVSRAWKDGP
ncbi:glycosyl transferase [Neoasaia chiangmaiensis]|uniref:Solute-binding protein family 5 domain-containing protein n=1 Tax=Neoasaia chiangmaiensis TaxID=320497 RepID=A0A1U9KP06_9PROT|nr:ABC transporter substrate-binding protein [Neoasaia chiangmaiensis]AQS87538.1 hypothetical protein A0U93_05845 [Neoasaia chiangmaiensis]GEN14080.1 glycosyl transferase [Neoasaia chiangmaiensis]